MNCYSKHMEIWQGLNPQLGGAIGLIDFDEEAISSLIYLRRRLIALADTGPGNFDAKDCLDPEKVFKRLSSLIRPIAEGEFQPQEWRKILVAIGFSIEEADKTFKHLDMEPQPPNKIEVRDITWLMNLHTMIDIDAVFMNELQAPSDCEAFRSVTWQSAAARNNKGTGAVRGSIFKETPEDHKPWQENARDRLLKLGIRPSPRSKSEQQQQRPKKKYVSISPGPRSPRTRDIGWKESGKSTTLSGKETPPTPTLMEPPETILLSDDDYLLEVADAESSGVAIQRSRGGGVTTLGSFSLASSQGYGRIGSPAKSKFQILLSDGEDN
jgi:hypothetical protein